MTLDHDPIFGKNVIETLSEGMYDNPLFLFREYVQNAADAIDAAERDGILKNGAGQIEVVVDKQRFPLCPEPTEIRGVWQNGFANFAPMYGGGKLPMN